MFARRQPPAAVALLYDAIVAQARLPAFYLAYGVPDTVMGRFDTIALHLSLVLRRLQREPERTAGFSQQLFDHMFRDMDRSLREMGAGDLGVGKRVKHLAQGLHGRAVAYAEALGEAPQDEGPLHAALRRNLYGMASPEPAVVARAGRYVQSAAAALDGQPAEALMAGAVDFGPAPDRIA